MFDTIVTNVVAPAAFVVLCVVLPLWQVLRTASRDRQRPDPTPRDPLQDWIRTAAILSGFGPFWYSAALRPPAPAPPSAARGHDHTPQGG